MNFSLVDNPQLIIAVAIGLCLVLVITVKFIWKSKTSLKADKGGVVVNGANKGTIKNSYRKGK